MWYGNMIYANKMLESYKNNYSTEIALIILRSEIYRTEMLLHGTLQSIITDDEPISHFIDNLSVHRLLKHLYRQKYVYNCLGKL